MPLAELAGAKRLETVANGLDALAQGQSVQLPTNGFAGELAEKLNRTGAQLQAKNEMLAGRTMPAPNGSQGSATMCAPR